MVSPGVIVLAAAVALLVLWKPRTPGNILSSAAQQDRVRGAVSAQVYNEGPRSARGIEWGLAAGGTGFAVGAALATAIGAVGVGAAAAGPVGAAAAFMVAAIIAGLNTDTYGRAVRDAVKKWLKDVELPDSGAACDALLFREALLCSEFVWHNATTGELAVEVTRITTTVPYQYKWPSLKRSPVLSLRAAREGILPGDAGRELQKAIIGWTLGRLDGPSQRETRRRWMEKAAVGDLYPIEYQPAPSSWRDPGTLLQAPWFASCWPSLGTSKVSKSSRWERIVPVPGNVDMLAARFDKAAGVDWTAKAAA